MIFEIEHKIEYAYSHPVFFEPHVFMMRPREDQYRKLVGFQLLIKPEPVLNTWEMDAFGNHSLRGWFRGLSENMTVSAMSRIEVNGVNPFDYIPDESCAKVPVKYSALNKQVLAPYFGKQPVAPAVAAFSERIAESVGRETSPFLFELCREIAAEFKRINRNEGDAWPATETLQKREGACRDLTVLFMECCRAQGLAARFISGYFEGDFKNLERELHAWAEVFVEGGGWRGFDPTSGLAVTERHIPVAVGNIPKFVAPVIGMFRGNDIISKMAADVRIRRAAA